jgi:chromosomal replication initiator protein
MDANSVKVQDDTIAAIKRAVAYFFGMPVEGLYQKSTTRAVTVPRQIAMYLVRQMTNASLPEIGRHFGGRHHSTVKHSITRVEEQRRTKDGVDLAIRVMLDSIKG